MSEFMKLLKIISTFLISLSLISCGGGGGGGSGSGNSGSSSGGSTTNGGSATQTTALAFNPTSLVASVGTGNWATLVVQGTLQNPSQITSSPYVFIEDNASVLDHQYLDLVGISSIAFSATMHTSSALAVGRYQGNLKIHLCKDANCNAEFPGSPSLLPYDITVTPAPLSGTPNGSTTATVSLGGQISGVVTVSVNGPSVAWTATTTAPWLVINGGSGTAPGSFTVGYVTQGLALGDYSANVSLQSADGQHVDIPFSLHVVTSGPINPPPSGLWAPSAGATPASGNYIYLQSDAGDYIGAGQTNTYTLANSTLNVSSTGGHLAVNVTGNQNWSGDFQTMDVLTQLQLGYYGSLTRYPFHNHTNGGLSWSGDGRGCNTLQGWFVIDNLAYVNGSITAIDLRFEQHCEGATAALHGKIHWTAGDTTTPPGPINPPPSGLWAPSAGATPASGNYIYLQSDAGDYIGAGRINTYTQSNSTITTNANGGHLTVNVGGNQNWSGDFQAMNTLTRLQPGYYGSLQRYPFHNPALGGLNWSGDGRGCNTLQGWFVIDNITYVNGSITAIDLRFEQHCEGATAALHGKIHWTAGDTTTPPGPVNPPPAGLWAPSAGATPASGNYIYLQSDAGDFIGASQTNTYTPSNSTITVNANGGHLTVNVGGWSGDFQAMNTLTRLQPGYYGSLQRYPFHNPALGGLSWSGNGRGCNTLQGWFVIDNVTYVGSNIAALDLRFEQHCEGGTPALHGAIHWTP